MANLSPGIALVYAPTRLDGLRRRWGTLGQARFLVSQAQEHERARRSPAKLPSRAGKLASVNARTDDAPRSTSVEQQAGFAEYESEDAIYRETLDQLEHDELQLGLPIRRVERSFLSNFDFSNSALVVVVGQDGLVANTAKYVGDLPIIAVNPDPQRIDGILLPFQPRGVRPIVQRVLDGKHREQLVTLAEVQLNDGQRLLAFNDFFLGAASHISARYVLECPSGSEPQSSSGVIVSTGAGSTGWMSSVFNMAQGVQQFLQGSQAAAPELGREDRRLVWAVREPFISKRSQAKLVAGWLDEGQELILESLMPEQGVIFSDGVEADFLPFNSGSIARVGVSQQRAHLVLKS